MSLSRHDIEQSRSVSADSLSPRQHRASRELRIAKNYWMAPSLKHPGNTVSEYHSYSEYLNAGLAEGNPLLTVFIPQPFRMRYRGKPYTPDALEIVSGKRFVVELKPCGEMDAGKRAALTAFFKLHNHDFIVRSNESVLEREWEALNWHTIVQVLTLHAALATDEAERHLLQNWPAGGISSLSDWVDQGDREGTLMNEIALFRLAHRGWIIPRFSDSPLSYTTEFHTCPSGVRY